MDEVCTQQQRNNPTYEQFNAFQQTTPDLPQHRLYTKNG